MLFFQHLNKFLIRSVNRYEFYGLSSNVDFVNQLLVLKYNFESYLLTALMNISFEV